MTNDLRIRNLRRRLATLSKQFAGLSQMDPPNLPQDLSKASKKQLKDTVLWLSKLPLKELRKRQDLTNAQIRENYRAFQKLNQADQKDPSHRVNMAARNLEIMSNLLIQAVDKNAFGDS